MPKLKINKNGEFYTTISFEGAKTIHFKENAAQWFNEKGITANTTLPQEWNKETKQWQYTHSKKTSNVLNHYSIKLFNAKCPICQKKVFFYQNEHGSKVFFDTVGYPWVKHPCTNKCTFDNYDNIEHECTDVFDDGWEKLHIKKIFYYFDDYFIIFKNSYDRVLCVNDHKIPLQNHADYFKNWADKLFLLKINPKSTTGTITSPAFNEINLPVIIFNEEDSDIITAKLGLKRRKIKQMSTFRKFTKCNLSYNNYIWEQKKWHNDKFLLFNSGIEIDIRNGYDVNIFINEFLSKKHIKKTNANIQYVEWILHNEIDLKQTNIISLIEEVTLKWKHFTYKLISFKHKSIQAEKHRRP